MMGFSRTFESRQKGNGDLRSACAFAVFCLCATSSFAKKPVKKAVSREAAAIRKIKAEEQPVGTLGATFLKPSPLAPEDAFYRRMFSKTDDGIYRQYQDRWSYHEMQIRYAATEWNYEHLSIGSLDFYGRAPYEGDVRREFAQQVLRVRLDSALRESLKGTEGARAVQKAQQAVDQIKNAPVVKVGGGEHPGEFRVGYDVLSDASKLEYVKGEWLAGIYHPHLLSALTGQRAGQPDLSLRLSAAFKHPLPSASISYQPGTRLVEASLARQLSRTVATRVLSSTPTSGGAAVSSYRVEVSYQF